MSARYLLDTNTIVALLKLQSIAASRKYRGDESSRARVLYSTADSRSQV